MLFEYFGRFLNIINFFDVKSHFLRTIIIILRSTFLLLGCGRCFIPDWLVCVDYAFFELVHQLGLDVKFAHCFEGKPFILADINQVLVFEVLGTRSQHLQPNLIYLSLLQPNQMVLEFDD